MKFDQNNKALISFLNKNMEACGYSTNVSAQDASIYEVFRDGRFVGTYDVDGDLDLMERSTGERERLQNIMEYTCAFADCQPAYMGQVQLSEYKDTSFTAAIDPETGKPVYYVFGGDAELNTPEDFKQYAHHNLQSAKIAFAEYAGLSSKDVYAERYEDKVATKHIEYLQGHGYKLAPATDGEDKRFMVRKDDQAVGFIDNDFHVHVTTNDDLVAKHMSSLRSRARWEVQQEDANGESVFTKRIADALVRLGYRVRHVWQELQMLTGVYRDGSEVARIDSRNQVEYTPAATKEDIQNIETAKERTTADLEKDYRRYQKAVQEVERDMVKPATPEQKQEADTQQQPMPELTKSEVFFLQAILHSDFCHELAAKKGMGDIIHNIIPKIYGALPAEMAQIYTVQNDAPEQETLYPEAGPQEPDDGMAP